MIRIRTTLTSDTPHLPELAPLVGRRVRVTVEEEPAAGEPGTPAVLPGTGDWAAADRAIQALHDNGFDFSVYDRIDEEDRLAAEEAQFGLTLANLDARRAAATRLRESNYDFAALAEQDAIDLADQEGRSG